MKTIGIFGLGSIGQRHKKNIEALGHKVIGFDPNIEKTMEQNKDEFQDVLKSADAIVIASPTATHTVFLEHAIAHKKPVLVEKPIADSDAPRVKAALDRAVENNIPVMMGNNLRFHPCVRKVKEWLDLGTFGNTLWANFTVAQYSSKHPYLRDGVMLNWGAHEIDLALHLLGPARVSAASMYSVYDIGDDIADINLHQLSGCQTTIHLDYHTEPEIRNFLLMGHGHRILCDLAKREAWYDKKHFKAKTDWDDDYIEEMKAFLDLVDGKELRGASGQDGLETLELILEAHKLAKK